MRIDGTLKTWHDDRGFGFIAPAQGGQEVFVHVSAFPRDGKRPMVGETLSFEPLRIVEAQVTRIENEIDALNADLPALKSFVLPGGTAYCTDVGMTGPRGGVIGVRREQSLERFLTMTNVRYEVADEDPHGEHADEQDRHAGEHDAVPSQRAAAGGPNRGPGVGRAGARGQAICGR